MTLFEKMFDDLFVLTNQKYPPVNISQDDEAAYIEVAVAGFSKDELSIEVENQSLIISGKKEPSQEKRIFYQKNIAFRDFILKYYLNERLDVSKASTSLNNGLLQIKIPYKTKAKTKKILEIT